MARSFKFDDQPTTRKVKPWAQYMCMIMSPFRLSSYLLTKTKCANKLNSMLLIRPLKCVYVKDDIKTVLFIRNLRTF